MKNALAHHEGIFHGLPRLIQTFVTVCSGALSIANQVSLRIYCSEGPSSSSPVAGAAAAGVDAVRTVGYLIPNCSR